MNNDFGFYGEEAEEEVVKDIKGVTDEVSEFIFSNMQFPCICLKPDLTFPKYKWELIRKMVNMGVAGKNITIYISRGGELYKIGALAGTQVNAFIDTLGIGNMIGYHNKDTKLEKDKLFVLSSMF